jgi:hypothetical protein
MDNTDEGKDVDFMIVTAPNRLWTCRAWTLLLARVAKLEGVGLCPNYLVTTNALEFKERSLYVAHEIAQMIPISGLDIYKEIRHRNAWVEDYLPHAVDAPVSPEALEPGISPSMAQTNLELIFSLPFGDWLEQWERRRKISRLRREQVSSFESFFSADVCKGHIDRHAENVVRALAARIANPPLPMGEGRGEGV